jgi:hypothetical protein
MQVIGPSICRHKRGTHMMKICEFEFSIKGYAERSMI